MFFRDRVSFRNWTFIVCALGVTLLSTASLTAFAGQDPVHERGVQKPPAKASAPSYYLEESVVKKMMDSGVPSEAIHIRILGQLIGDWYYTAAVWAVPGAEPQRATGKVTNEMVLGNRFLSSAALGNLSIGGQLLLLKGQGFLGYDNVKKTFTSVWLDTMTTGIMTGAGNYDKKRNAIEETGQFTNPLTGREERFRSELQFTDGENYKRTIFVIGKSGKESKLMEFDYSKKIP